MLSYQLPPKPPAGAFDVRFAEDMKVTESAGAIEIMNNTDMLTISYTINIDAGEYLRWVLTSDEGKEYGLNGSGEIVVGGDVTGFNLSKAPEIPLTYSISQNYPNPFNPSASIDYELNKVSRVTVKILQFGREIGADVGESDGSAGIPLHHVARSGQRRPASPHGRLPARHGGDAGGGRCLLRLVPGIAEDAFDEMKFVAQNGILRTGRSPEPAQRQDNILPYELVMK